MAASNITQQLRYTGKGYVDEKMQPLNNVSDLNTKFKNNNELKLGLTVTILNGGGPNIPVDYWYYYPYNEETGTFDTTAPANWYPKIFSFTGGEGEIYWEDGGESPASADFEAWKDGGIE